MASVAETIQDVGRRLGLQAAAGGAIVYGVKDGYLVEVARGGEGGDSVVEIVRHDDPSRDAAVLEAVRTSAELAARGLKPANVSVDGGVVVYKRGRRLFRSLDAAAVAADVEALLRAVKASSAPAPAVCRVCKSTSGSDPILLNGVVDRVCPACIERLQHEVKQAVQRYEDLPLNLPLAVVTAAVLAVVAAVAWAGIAIATNRMFWIVGIGAGLLIGWGTTKAAGRGGLAPQAVGGIFTVISVLLGQILFVAYHSQQYARARGGSVNWDMFVSRLPTILWDLGGDTLFALGGGLIGAYYAARFAAKPRLEVTIQKS